MNRARYILFSLAGLACPVLLLGCATTYKGEAVTQQISPKEPPKETAQPKEPVSPAIPAWSKYRALALGHEKSEALQKALFMWRVVEQLSPGHQEARDRIKELEERSRVEAEKHYLDGIDNARRGLIAAARKEFLLTLAYDPERKEALAYLRQKAIEADYVECETKEGETPATVAKRVYGDPGTAFIVAYFNDLTSDGQLKGGKSLRLPILEGEAKARTELPDAKTKAATAPRTHDKASAERHYAKGIGHFLAQELPEAVKEWDETLRLYPDHPNAQRDMQKALNLLRKEALK
jgi:tetratricopeptide (TPR) repeat protein